MAVGKQPETLIVQWHPGESSGTDGFGMPGASLPVSENADTLADAEAYTDLLEAKLVASGVLPA